MNDRHDRKIPMSTEIDTADLNTLPGQFRLDAQGNKYYAREETAQEKTISKPSDADAVKLGDVVRLKSGSPCMTITGHTMNAIGQYETGFVTAQYFDETSKRVISIENAHVSAFKKS